MITMVTLSRKAKIPVYDADGNLLYYEVDYVPAPFERNLRLGGSHLDEIALESRLRQHKKQLGWKEPPRAVLKCKMCGKVVKKEHPTQKYCKECGIKAKRKNASRRQVRYAKKKRQERRDHTHDNPKE